MRGVSDTADLPLSLDLAADLAAAAASLYLFVAEVERALFTVVVPLSLIFFSGASPFFSASAFAGPTLSGAVPEAVDPGPVSVFATGFSGAEVVVGFPTSSVVAGFAVPAFGAVDSGLVSGLAGDVGPEPEDDIDGAVFSGVSATCLALSPCLADNTGVAGVPRSFSMGSVLAV
ncbi:hypothetical protein ACFSUD_18395 [Sulfitobacter aestuarii]|uniref:Uncharacterized protein n=1 Tax=Sulfitobacter aestuarii TaxID=2161676 RepID=A0ABW5U6K4_9RHOB